MKLRGVTHKTHGYYSLCGRYLKPPFIQGSPLDSEVTCKICLAGGMSKFKEGQKYKTKKSMSTLRRTLTETGTQGTFTAEVWVKFNHRKETKTVQQPVTHDEVERTFSYHIVIGKVGEHEIKSDEFQNESAVFVHLEKIEERVAKELYALANTPKTETVYEQLNKLGYK